MIIYVPLMTNNHFIEKNVDNSTSTFYMKKFDTPIL